MSAPPGVLLEARDVRKAYGRHEVLRGADLAAGPGQLVGGGGGERGREVHPAEDPRRHPGRGRRQRPARRDAGLLPARPGAQRQPHRGASICATSPPPAGSRRWTGLRNCVGQLGYAGCGGTSAGALSGGTRQKLNLTLALMHDPDVLLLDEPYQGFDWETYLRFWDLVTDLRARRKAIVIITHLVFEQDRFDLLADLSGGRLTRRAPSGKDDHARR